MLTKLLFCIFKVCFPRVLNFCFQEQKLKIFFLRAIFPIKSTICAELSTFTEENNIHVHMQTAEFILRAQHREN